MEFDPYQVDYATPTWVSTLGFLSLLAGALALYVLVLMAIVAVRGSRARNRNEGSPVVLLLLSAGGSFASALVLALWASHWNPAYLASNLSPDTAAAPSIDAFWQVQKGYAILAACAASLDLLALASWQVFWPRLVGSQRS